MAREEYGFLLHRSVRTFEQYSEVLKIVPGVLMAERGYNVPGVLLTERGYNVPGVLLTEKGLQCYNLPFSSCFN